MLKIYRPNRIKRLGETLETLDEVKYTRFIEIQFTKQTTKLTKLNRFTFGGNCKRRTITTQSKSAKFY